MPTLFERLSTALKSLKFPDTGANSNKPYVIYSSMQDWQHAIAASLPGESDGPSSDPQASSLVLAGVRWLSATLPEAPVEVIQPTEEGPEAIEPHPLVKLLRRPNPYTSSATIWKSFAWSWIINGNVFWLKFRNPIGQVVQLWNEPFFSIRPRWVNDKQGEYIPGSRSQSLPGIGRDDSPELFINYYEVDRDGQKLRIEPQDVVHFKDGEDPLNRRMGLSYVASILREIYGDSAAANYAGGMMAANGVPPFVLSIDDKVGQLTQPDIDGIKAGLMRQMRSAGGREPLVTQFARVEKLVGPEDLNLSMARYLSEERFSAITGIPLEVLNLGAGNVHSTYNNVREAERSATQRYLVPLWWYIDEEMTVQLLPDFDTNEQHYVEHDTSEVASLQEDENAKWSRVGTAYQNQIIMRSEARTELGFEAEDGDDVYLVKAGTETVTLEQEVELRENPPAPPPQLSPNGLPEETMPPPRQLAAAKGIYPLSSRAQQEKTREHWERHAPKRVRGLISAKGK